MCLNEFERCPLVSIITPTYNHEKFIRDCIESVLAQTHQNWEQIIVDDGSTDGTAEIVKKYQDPRVRYCHQPNAGIEALAHTYNRALSLARGKLIAILEGDDFWPPGKLARMLPAFDDISVVLAYGQMREAETDGKPAAKMTRNAASRSRLPLGVLNNDPPPKAAAYMLTAQGHSMIPASTAILRRSTLEAIGGFQHVPELRYVDFPTFVTCALHGKFFYYDEVLGYRRQHAKSATSRYALQMLSASQQLRKLLVNDSRYALTDPERIRIEKSCRFIRSTAEYNMGRIALFEGKWELARAHFFHALRCMHSLISLASAAGWLLSWFHCDLEPIYQMTGRAALKADP